MKDKILSVLKLVLAILLLPLVIGVTVSFWQNLVNMDRAVSAAFGWGVVVYLILHILLYEPAQVFDTGKKITEKAMTFLSPLVKVGGFCIPIFTILAFAFYFVASKIWTQYNLFPSFIFVASFTLTMHLVFTANALKGKQAGVLKENYFFSIFLIYLINMLIVAGAFTFLSNSFSFLSFIKKSGEVAGAIYTVSFKQLFEVESRRPVQ